VKCRPGVGCRRPGRIPSGPPASWVRSTTTKVFLCNPPLPRGGSTMVLGGRTPESRPSLAFVLFCKFAQVVFTFFSIFHVTPLSLPFSASLFLRISLGKAFVGLRAPTSTHNPLIGGRTSPETVNPSILNLWMVDGGGAGVLFVAEHREWKPYTPPHPPKWGTLKEKRSVIGLRTLTDAMRREPGYRTRGDGAAGGPHTSVRW